VHDPLSDAQLPPARVVPLPGRGEAFVRVGPDRDGTPPVVLLHGWLTTADLNWFAVYEPLGRSHRIVAPDLRGHGRGPRGPQPFSLEGAADDVAGILTTLGTGPAVVCGYSMGGAVALHMARRHPELVNGLVVCAGALEWRSRWYDRAAWRCGPVLAAALRLGADRWAARRMIDDLAAGDDLVARWRPHLLGEAERLDPAGAVEVARAMARYDARPFVAGLTVPAAVVATRRDRLVRPGRQLRLAEALGAVRVDLEGDHYAFLRQPRDWADAVVSAVRSVAHRPDPGRATGTGPTDRSPT
jgi:pimeloyl-ACP methyl ester carboxylesterase